MAYITGGNNNKPNDVLSKWDEEVLIIDEIVFDTQGIGISIHHTPNQPLVFPSDPI